MLLNSNFACMLVFLIIPTLEVDDLTKHALFMLGG